MPDLTAVPVSQGMAPSDIPMFFGGFFDQPVIGIPVYLWIFMLMFTFGALYVVYTVYVWWNLGPVWGWYQAYKSGEPQALKMNKHRKMRFQPTKIIASIFYNDEDTDMFHQTSLEAAQYLGGVPTVLCCDWHDWIDDPIINEAICDAAEAWNENEKKIGGKDFIHDYVSFQKHLANGTLQAFLPDGVNIPAFFIVEFSKIERYMPKERSASTFGGFITYYAKQLQDQLSKTLWGMLMPIGAICGMVLITAIAAYLILQLAK